jgi:hypothetical protein
MNRIPQVFLYPSHCVLSDTQFDSDIYWPSYTVKYLVRDGRLKLNV